MRVGWISMAALLLSSVPQMAVGGSIVDVDWKAGKLSRLAKHIGTYHYDTVLIDPDVDAALNKLMTAKEKKVLVENLQVSPPIAFSGTHMILSGNKPHSGSSDTALVALSLKDASIHVLVQHASKVNVYSAEPFKANIPGDFLLEVQRFETNCVHMLDPCVVVWVGRSD
jgi:hypothetical protein